MTTTARRPVDRLTADHANEEHHVRGPVFIRRGPWGYYYPTRAEVEKVDARIDGLAELPERLDELNGER